MTPPIPPALLGAVAAQYRLDPRGVHGVAHWDRVLENGLAMAPATGARADIVALFAVLHDACRHNDIVDPEHGPRAARLARCLHADGLVALDAAGLGLLADACHGHTHGRLHADPTVQTCWDADRLDLGRVGIVPRADWLGSDAARDRLDAAYRASVEGSAPAVAAVWAAHFSVR